jgi:hypothetical protein
MLLYKQKYFVIFWHWIPALIFHSACSGHLITYDSIKYTWNIWIHLIQNSKKTKHNTVKLVHKGTDRNLNMCRVLYWYMYNVEGFQEAILEVLYRYVRWRDSNRLCLVLILVCEVGATAHKGHIFRFLSVPLCTSLTVLCLVFFEFWIRCIHIFQVYLMESYVIRCPEQANYLVVLSFHFEHIWWRFFQKRVVCTKLDIHFFTFYCSTSHDRLFAKCKFKITTYLVCPTLVQYNLPHRL